MRQLLDAMENVPALVQNGRLDILAINRLGQAVFSEMYAQPQRPANFGRFVFLDPRAHTFYRDWDDAAHQTVALLRTKAGRVPHDRALTDLVGELSTRSDAFRTLWASHDVREHRTGIKIIHHPVVGDLDLSYEAMDLTTDRGLLFLAYTAQARSPSHDALTMLNSWEATNDQTFKQPADRREHHRKRLGSHAFTTVPARFPPPRLVRADQRAFGYRESGTRVVLPGAAQAAGRGFESCQAPGHVEGSIYWDASRIDTSGRRPRLQPGREAQQPLPPNPPAPQMTDARPSGQRPTEHPATWHGLSAPTSDQVTDSC